MLDRIKERLLSLGYQATIEDDLAIQFVLDKVTARFCHSCNIAELPVGVDTELIDAVCGEFLLAKKSMGTLNGIELEAVVKAITEGDTKVEFATGANGADDIFNAYMNKLMAIDSNIIARYRKLVW
jgi:hypothetical protein